MRQYEIPQTILDTVDLTGKCKPGTRTFDKDTFKPSTNLGVSMFREKSVDPLQAIVDLYYATTERGNFQKIVVPPELYDYAAFIYNSYGEDIKKIKTNTTLQTRDYKVDKDFTLTMFSGGMDSTALAYKHRNVRPHNRMCYIQGINFAYPKEIDYAKIIAEKYKQYGIEADFLRAYVPTTKGLPESPVKNALGMVMAMEYYGASPYCLLIGDSDGIKVDEFGVEEPESINRLPGEENDLFRSIQVWSVAGDSPESVKPLFKFLEAAYGQLNPEWFMLRDEAEALEMCRESGVDRDVSSCMVIISWRFSHRRRLLEKYSSRIPEEDQTFEVIVED